MAFQESIFIRLINVKVEFIARLLYIPLHELLCQKRTTERTQFQDKCSSLQFRFQHLRIKRESTFCYVQSHQDIPSKINKFCFTNVEF